MPIRLMVGTLMRGVVLVAVVLGAGRVHLSLGSLAFGVLSIAWVRTTRWAGRRRAGGANVGRLRVVGEFFLEVGPAVVSLAVAAVPTAITAFAIVKFDVFNSRGRGPSGGAVMVAALAAGLAGAATLRLCRKP